MPEIFATLFFLILALFRANLWAVGASTLALIISCCCKKNPDSQIPPLALFLGFITPLLPMMDGNAVLCVALIYLLQTRTNKTNWAFPFLFIASAWVLGEAIVGFDFETIKTVWLGKGKGFFEHASNILTWIKVSPPHFVLSLHSLATLYTFALLAQVFSTKDNERRAASFGIFLGLFIAAVLTILQILGFYPELFSNQNSYWSSINRFTGTFSDPNAFGVFIALCLPLFFIERKSNKWLHLGSYGLGFVWLCLGLYSGSRSYVLALFIYAIFLFGKWNKKALLFSLLALSSATLLLNESGIFFYLTHAEHTPEGIRRVLETLTFESSFNALKSRIIFFNIDFLVWKAHPILGVGFERFREMVPIYARTFYPDIGLWTDNPNSFYLQVLSELGILGFITLVISLRNLSIKRKVQYLSKLPLYALLVLLVFGPHLEFVEVSVLSAILVGGLCDISNKNAPSPIYLRFIGAVFLIVILLCSWFGEWGFYGLERDGNTYFRWTARRARSSMKCSEAGEAKLHLKIFHPDIESNPLSVSVTPMKGEQIINTLSSGGDLNLKFSCPSVFTSKGPGYVPYLPYKLTVSRVWQPRNYGIGEDARALGVQVVDDPLENRGSL